MQFQVLCVHTDCANYSPTKCTFTHLPNCNDKQLNLHLSLAGANAGVSVLKYEVTYVNLEHSQNIGFRFVIRYPYTHTSLNSRFTTKPVLKIQIHI